MFALGSGSDVTRSVREKIRKAGSIFLTSQTSPPPFAPFQRMETAARVRSSTFKKPYAPFFEDRKAAEIKRRGRKRGEDRDSFTDDGGYKLGGEGAPTA